jgi:hypothetical protein
VVTKIRIRAGLVLVAATLAALAALQAHAFALEDTYKMARDQRIWYFAGIYDAALVDPRTRDCARSLGFERFMQSLSRFITELPPEADSATRRSFDRMPAAAVAQLVIDAECRR